MKAKPARLILLFSCLLLFCQSVKSQSNPESDTVKTKCSLIISADFVSRFVWRGSDYGNSAAIQPTLALNAKNLELGCWGTIATNSSYTEIDLYAKFSYKSIALILTDYFAPLTNDQQSSPDIRYFNFRNKTTAHAFEAALTYKRSEKFPLAILGGVYLYGNDKRWGYDATKDSSEQTYYSTYLEAAYSFAIRENSLDVFLGLTPTAGAYAKKPGIVNLGVSANRKIKINESFEIPIKASLVFNPIASTAFFVLSLSL